MGGATRRVARPVAARTAAAVQIRGGSRGVVVPARGRPAGSPVPRDLRSADHASKLVLPPVLGGWGGYTPTPQYSRSAASRSRSSASGLSLLFLPSVTIRRNSETVARPVGVAREQVRLLVKPESGEVW